MQNQAQNQPVSVAQLQQQFGIADAVRFDHDEAGLIRATLTSKAGTGVVYLHGGHVTSYRPDRQPDVLFVSDRSRFKAGEPIRGGIPVCFPWFADHGSPKHGTARLQLWQVADTSTTDQSTSIELTLDLAPFHLRYRVTIGQAMDLTLQVQNTSQAEASFELALHTYFAVADVRQIEVQGLDGRAYLDKTHDFAEFTQAGPIRVEGEVDRVYPHSADTCTLHDPGHGRAITIEKTSAHSTIVWNPWTDKASQLDDMANDEWQRFVCIESGNVHDDAVSLQADQTHETKVRIASQPQ